MRLAILACLCALVMAALLAWLRRVDRLPGKRTLPAHAEGSELAECRRQLADALRVNESLRLAREVMLDRKVQDEEARKRIETSLAYERHLMSSLLDTLPDQIFFKDMHHKFLRVNPSLAHRLGLRHPDELIGKSDANYFTPARADRTAAIERQIMESGEPVIDLEDLQWLPDQPPTWQLITTMPLRDEQNRIIGTFGISRDITERKRIEAQLQETSERFAIASDSAGIGVWELDVASNSLRWDDWTYRLYGIARGSGTESYATWAGCLHPEERARCESQIALALRGEAEFDTEFRIVRPDGEIRNLKAVARALRALDGRALRLTGVIFDVTERRRAELQLIETSSLLRTVLDSAAEISIIATDPDFTIKVFNAGAERLLGYSSAEVVDRKTPLFIHDADEVRVCAEELSAKLGESITHAAVLVEPSMIGWPHEWTYIHRNGERITVSLVVTAMRTQEGALLGYVAVAHDVTRQNQYEESLRNAMDKAEQASGAKSLFLANMSHEIRTPMHAVIGLTYLLGRTPLNDEQADCLKKIELASKTLLAVITDVLDLSKIEASELMVECAPFDPRHLMQELTDVIAVQADAKGIKFHIDAANDLPEALQGDATRVKQILTNLLANAIRFTDHGSVELCVRVTAATSTRVTLSFVVQDTGIGITAEAQARLFTPFAQADASITRRYGGTGLGLSIVKSLTNLLGGEVSLHSTPGAGSRFTVVLQFALTAPEALAVRQAPTVLPDAHPLQDVRVLIVDDSDINLEVAKRILELYGASVWLACSGHEALEQLERQPLAFDVVLMDVQMPGLDGYETTRRIRDELGLTELSIIALTAGALSSERQRAVAAGMNDFIIKPFDASTLVFSILRQVGDPGAQGAAPVHDVPDVRPQVHVPWPAIEGVDSSDARGRFIGDLDLFLSLLKRLLEEYSDVAGMAATQGSRELAIHARRMHKLKGSAGMLGAKTIHQLASEAEAACTQGELERTRHLAKRLAFELERVRLSAQATFEASRKAAERAALSSGIELAAGHLDELLELLGRQSLSAISCFNSVSPQLRGMLGSVAYERVSAYMDNLQFNDAARALDEHRRARTPILAVN